MQIWNGEIMEQCNKQLLPYNIIVLRSTRAKLEVVRENLWLPLDEFCEQSWRYL